MTDAGSTLFPHWFRHSAIQWPASGQSIGNGAAAYTKVFGPLRKCLGRAIEGYLPIISLIVVLLGASSPAAIVWLIAFAVVLSIDAVLARWPWSHISQERLKALRPATTDCDPLAAVGWVGPVVGVQASSLDASPNFIFSRFREAMGTVVGGRYFVPQAPTTERFGPDKVASEDGSFCPAQALTCPVAFAGISNYYPSAKSLAGQVFQIRVFSNVHDSRLVR